MKFYAVTNVLLNSMHLRMKVNSGACQKIANLDLRCKNC